MARAENKIPNILKIIAGLVVCYAAFVLFSVVGKDTGPWEGKVLDIDTGEPIEGVVILAIWRTETAGIIDYSHSVNEVTESVTDEKGYFFIHQYHPLNFLPAISETKGPYIHVYKPGYLYLERKINPLKLTRGASKKDSSGKLQFSQELNLSYKVSANTIELPKLPKLSLDEKKKHLLITRPGDVPLDKMKNLTNALNEARASLGYSPLK